jgi:hypothetical protein
VSCPERSGSEPTFAAAPAAAAAGGALSTTRRPAAPGGWARSLAEAVVASALAALVAVTVNALRPDGLPLVASEPYQILVPCPEPGGPVSAVDAIDPAVRSPRSFVVDARSPAEFAAAHASAAVNLTFDWLDPVPEAALSQLARDIAASGATRVVVYGDGGRPDSGEHLGREISGRGIKNVSFVAGGAPALFDGLER